MSNIVRGSTTKNENKLLKDVPSPLWQQSPKTTERIDLII